MNDIVHHYTFQKILFYLRAVVFLLLIITAAVSWLVWKPQILEIWAWMLARHF